MIDHPCLKQRNYPHARGTRPDIQKIITERLQGNAQALAAIKALQDENAEQQADLEASAKAVQDSTLPPVETVNAIAETLTESEAVPGEVTPAFPA
jgi:hypothetical protein